MLKIYIILFRVHQMRNGKRMSLVRHKNLSGHKTRSPWIILSRGDTALGDSGPYFAPLSAKHLAHKAERSVSSLTSILRQVGSMCVAARSRPRPCSHWGRLRKAPARRHAGARPEPIHNANTATPRRLTGWVTGLGHGVRSRSWVTTLGHGARTRGRVTELGHGLGHRAGSRAWVRLQAS